MGRKGSNHFRRKDSSCAAGRTPQFVACAIGGISVGEMIKTFMPFYGALIAALLLGTYVPVFSLGLPRLFLGKL